MGTVLYSHSQEFQIPSFELPKITLFSEGGQVYAKIPFERAVLIDQWARRGVEAKVGKEAEMRAIYLEKLMEQIRQAKLQSDSVAVATQIDLFNVRKEVSTLSYENTKLQKGYALCQQDNDRLTKENSKLRSKVFWKDVSKYATYIGLGLGALVLITN